VSEQILNGTSAHIGYTVPFTSVYAGKYRQKTVKTKTKHNPEKANNKTQPNKTSLVQSTFTTLGQETRWAYSTMLRRPHGAHHILLLRPVW